VIFTGSLYTHLMIRS